MIDTLNTPEVSQDDIKALLSLLDEETALDIFGALCDKGLITKKTFEKQRHRIR